MLWLYVSAILKYYNQIKLFLNNTLDYNELFPVYKVEILQVTVNKIEVLSSF